MKELPPADVLRLDLTQQFFDAVTTGYFVATVLFCFLIVLVIVVGCWEATRKSRGQASGLEPLRREETSPATAAPLCVYDTVHPEVVGGSAAVSSSTSRSALPWPSAAADLRHSRAPGRRLRPPTTSGCTVYDRGPDSILAVALPQSDAGLSRNPN